MSQNMTKILRMLNIKKHHMKTKNYNLAIIGSGVTWSRNRSKYIFMQ